MASVILFSYIWGRLNILYMKKAFRLFLLALFCLVSVVMNAQSDNVVRILAIGNSFSEDAVEQHLYDLAKADGVEVIIGNMYIGGCSLKKHLTNANKNKPAYKYRKIGLDGRKVQTLDVTLETALADEKWDYVSFQQQSGQSGIYESWAESLPELLAYVKARVPAKTKMMIHQTWAYDSTSTHRDFVKYDHDQQKMYSSIIDAVKRSSKLTKIKMVIPSGTAVQNARTTLLKDKVTRDGYHLHKTYGRYTAACTWYEKIFKKNVIGNAYRPAKMTAEEQLAAQKSAHAAVKKPNKVTIIK